MNIAHGAVTRPVTVAMRIAALVLLGIVCMFRLPVDLLPKVSLPIVAVITSWPNVSAEDIETEITRPIEEQVSAAPDVNLVRSTSHEGSSMVIIQFNWGANIGQAAVDVLQLVERAQRAFPQNEPTIQTPIVFKFDPSQLPILVYGVSGIKDPVKLRTLMDNEVSPMIEGANGVASATVTGGDQRAIIVDVDPVKLQARGLTLNEVSSRIAQENVDLPAGIAKESNTEYTIRSLGLFTSPKQIAQVPLTTLNGHIVTLGEVATVRDSHEETRIFTRYNGKPAVGLIIEKQSGANTIATTKAVQQRIGEVKKIYPELNFGVAYNQADYIKNSIRDVEMNAAIGGLLAVLILLFFLRNIRSTMVVALSIPTSIISTFALLYLAGFTLNTMTLGGLALSTGLIVDDAVVVLENIFRHMERDRKSAWDAAIDGTNEILSAVFASTWTVMVVFLPLMFIKGMAGQMFTQFALVVIFALALSLLDAATVVPMLATRLISGEAHAEALAGEGRRLSLLQRAFRRFGVWFDALDRTYRAGLAWALQHRLAVVGIAGAITVSSLLLVPRIGVELMPETDSGDFSITLKMPIGTALAKTDETMRKLEALVLRDPDVQTEFSASGTNLTLSGNTTAEIPFQGSITVHLKPKRRHSTLQVMNALRRETSQLPGAHVLIQQRDIVTMLMTGGPTNIEVDIFGDNLQELSSLASEAMQRCRNIVGLQNLDVNWQPSSPEIQWQVDRDKAEQLGLSFSDIANTINIATGTGPVSSYYQENGFEYPILVQEPEADRKTIAEMDDLVISPSGAGSKNPGVLLGQVAKPVFAAGPSEITRLNRQRYIAITGMAQGRSSGQIQNDIQKVMQSMTLPKGYYWQWGWFQQQRGEEFGGMTLAVILAIGLIYMLLAAQFENFLHPLTILLAVPLAIVGVCLAMFLTGRAFGLTAFIGVLMLVGIVVKNGILLVDYTNLLRRQGLERNDAILRAGPTRLRPILMTASAAILGMLPIAIGIGRGSEIQAPMATAVIGGLATSTFLTLFVVPVVYSGLDDVVQILRRWRQA